MGILRLTGQDAKNQVTNSANVTATYPSTPTQGNMLIATVVNSGQAVGNTSITSGGTWSGVEMDIGSAGAARSVGIWVKQAGASEGTSVTAARSSGTGDMRIHIYEYSGVDFSVNWLRSSAGAFGTGATSIYSNAANTIVVGDMLFACVGTSGTISAPSWPTPDVALTTLQSDASNLRLFDGAAIAASASATGVTGSWTSSQAVGTVLVVVRATPTASSGGKMTLLGVGG